MLDPQYRRPRNTTISAVAVLEEVCIEQYWSGFQAELQARKDALEVETSDNVGDIHRKLGYDALVAKYEKQGVNLDRKIPRLRLLHNPYARIAWPQHLTSDADESWGWELNHDATCYHMVKVLDGLRPES